MGLIAALPRRCAVALQALAYPYSIVTGVTAERFEQLLRDAAQAVRDDPKAPPAVLINAWNEWTEGQFLLPEEHYGTAHLEAVRKVFGIRKE